jgi:pimeloyl-ACP methyl ester carboxylesterase
VARQGHGPPLVFLHGYPDNLQIWSRLLPRLSTSHTTIAFDWPGLGASESWPGGVTPQHLAGRVLRLLDAWGLERAGLVGMDMGGQPALVLAALHPERIARLVVMNSLVFGDVGTSWEIALLRRLGANRVLLRHAPRQVFERALRTSLPAGVDVDRELRADLWRAFSQPSVRATLVRMCAGYQATLPALPNLYRRIACPTLVLWGEHDRHFPLPQARALQAAIPGALLHVVQGAPHWMAWSDADRVASAILAGQ